MSEPTVLLASRSLPVIKSVQSVHDSVSPLEWVVCPDLDSASARLGSAGVALVLAHLPAVGGDSGATQLLRAVAATGRPCPTLVLADGYHEHQANALLRAGAADYLELPLDLGKLAYLLDALTRRLRPSAWSAPASPDGPPDGAGWEGLGELLAQVRRVAPQETTVLLTGQTGTGKTRLARLIHESSPRRAEPFLTVDCAALSANLVESELFGHTRGAFTGADRERTGKLAAAGRGTLLIDEVNSLPLPLQAKLLRAVDERVFEPLGSNRAVPLRARLVAASNADLQAEVAAGRFRADLFHRLNVVGFFLPPLRDRPAAVAPLARRFLAEFAARNRPDVTGLTEAALRALGRYSWPGNVRELRNALERAVALCPGPEVGVEDLPPAVQPAEEGPALALAPSELREVEAPSTLAQSKRDVELRRIQEALHRHRNNRLRAAAELGISRMALYKKLHKHGILQPQ